MAYICLSQYSDLCANEEKFIKYLTLLTCALIRCDNRCNDYREVKLIYQQCQRTYNPEDVALEALFCRLLRNQSAHLDEGQWPAILDRLAHNNDILNRIMQDNIFDFLYNALNIPDLEPTHIQRIVDYYIQAQLIKFNEGKEFCSVYLPNDCHLYISKNNEPSFAQNDKDSNLILTHSIIKFIDKYQDKITAPIFDGLDKYLNTFYCLAYGYLRHWNQQGLCKLLTRVCFGDREIPSDIQDAIGYMEHYPLSKVVALERALSSLKNPSYGRRYDIECQIATLTRSVGELSAVLETINNQTIKEEKVVLDIIAEAIKQISLAERAKQIKQQKLEQEERVRK